MKHGTLFFFIGTFLFFSINSCVYNWSGSVNGNGNVLSELRSVKNFSELDISGMQEV